MARKATGRYGTVGNILGPLIVLGLIGGAFAVFFGPVIMDDMETDRILETGIPATARVIDLADTGNRFNGNPEVEISLEVTPTEGEPFETVAKTVMSAVELREFQPGMIVHVKYDQQDRSKVAVVP